MENNKSLMTLYGDLIVLLSKAMEEASLNTLNEFMERKDVRLRETGQKIIDWKTINTDIKSYLEELRHYRANLMNNPVVHQGLDINKLAEYRSMTIIGLKTIKRHALYSKEDQERTAMNDSTERLKNACNFLLGLIRNEIGNTEVGKLQILREAAYNWDIDTYIFHPITI